MFDYIFGLPMHALVIHAVVVLGPLSALVAVAYAVRPRWRRALRWPTALGALVTGGGAYVAAESGERLFDRVMAVRGATTNQALLIAHEEAGDRAKQLCLVFMVVALVAVALVREPRAEEPRRHALEVIVAVVLVLAAIAATITIVLAGHAGSTVVWDGLA